MPVYEYQCEFCSALITEYQKLSDKPLKKCPECKKNKLFKIISLPARPVVPGNPLDEYAKIKKEAKHIAQKIVNGDEKYISDIYGEDVANGKSIKELPKPKTLNEVNGKGIIKRKNT